ncbi:sulfhydryl oxidase [Schizosaccharomyces japonicus yFS275]|uniref:Sulfhydryl oxidase n=1 Tax=Schizosaccharomyces japonicus (strain yFS275 / FY16936) TaxID=402676 RepID=B6JYI6_SCHJY|nr:sulfhydryl oxidase [Schizosaccharomyces japonicus yFS275]EEB06604.1 sulfhydryl oxidase [Schizosaccharomyces japonicus yFS275]
MFGFRKKRYRDKETGIVYDENGKPCKTCNIFSAFQNQAAEMTSPTSSNAANGSHQQKQSAASTNENSQRIQQPPVITNSSKIVPQLPNVAELGRATWTFLHAMAATYPHNPSAAQQAEMYNFLHSFSRFYPCWSCAEDLRLWIAKDGNEPRVGSRRELTHWVCEAHNDVNVRMGKPAVDCNIWAEKASKLAD